MVDFSKMTDWMGGRSQSERSDPSRREASPDPSPSQDQTTKTTGTQSEPDFSGIAAEVEPETADPGDQAEGDDGAGQAGMDPAAPTLLTREQFYEVFCGMFQAGGAITGLQSLPVGDGEADQARAASDALYDTALEVEALRFLIEPGNKWVQRALVIGLFGWTKYHAVNAELRARRRPPKKPANDNQAAGNAEGSSMGILSEMEPDAPKRDQ